MIFSSQCVILNATENIGVFMRAVKEKAYAKINLFLDVISKRDDGFHEIKTVMHLVSLADEITVIYTPSTATNIRLFVSGNRYIPSDAKNLAFLAAKLYLDEAGIKANIEIKLKKNIPVAAGLAGGSTDAAAVLRAMNKLFGRMFSEAKLTSLAAKIGSDVPFCLCGKTSLCEGRGEIMTKLSTSMNLHFVIAVASEYVSTPEAYAALDKLYSNFDGSVKSGAEDSYMALMDVLSGEKITQRALFNIFEDAVLDKCVGASNLKKTLLELGGICALMSGSGPSVYGVFESENAARQAVQKLKEFGYNAHYAKSVNC